MTLDETQNLCEELAGGDGDLTILEPGEGSKAAAPSDVYFGADEGDGIFEPGGHIEDAELIEHEVSPAAPMTAKSPKTFTGAAKGKGGLK